MHSARPVFLIALGWFCFIGASGAAVATPDQPSAVAAGQPASIPENEAEIQAIANGELALEPAPAAETAAARPLSPEMVEINAAMAAERAQVDDLAARLQAATDDAMALALEREIETAKRSTELAILGIQARHARAAGREAQAQEIEAAISQMTAVMNVPATITAPGIVPPASHPTDGSR